MLIEVKNLELRSKGKVILHPLSFSISKGEIVCIAGRNGSGKTSLLKCISGLTKAYQGEITLSDGNLSTPLGKMGILIDGISLYSHLTGKENLDIIRRYYSLPPAIIKETLELVGLQDDADKRVKYYSLGMKQRLAIGVAFINKPNLVILDEPLNALDPEAIVSIRQLIKRLNHDFGTTFIITSHSLEEISKTATHILILKNGYLLMNIDRETLADYWSLKGTLKPNTAMDGIQLPRYKKLMFKMNPESVEIIGERDTLNDILNLPLADLINWLPLENATLEALYLMANSLEQKEIESVQL